MNELEMLVEALGIQLEKERRSAVLAAFQPVAQEIAKLRSLDLTDVHPAVVFSPVLGEPAGLRLTMHDNPITRPVAELSADLRLGKLTSIDLLENALDRIAMLDCKLESFVCLSDDARALGCGGRS